MKTEVAIIGGGLAGLAAARTLSQRGVDFQLFEAADGLGGRVRTDVVDGYRLDRGFQVMLEAYPECREMLDYEALELCRFAPGAKIFSGGQLHTVADPLRAPSRILDTLQAPIGSLGDKWRIFALRRRASEGSLEDLFSRPESSTLELLQDAGFSRQIIDTLFRPWFGGIFLGRDLSTSSRMFEFVYRMMAEGHTSVPALGMGEIPRQLAKGLPADAIHLNRPAKRVLEGRVELADGEVVVCDRVIVATEAPAAEALLGRTGIDRGSRAVTCLYFAAPAAAVDGPWLVLDGDTTGPINNLAFMGQVSAEYAPADRELVSVTVLQGQKDERALQQAVLRQLRRWFGTGVDTWEHLRTYQIRHAQPEQLPGMVGKRPRWSATDSILICGDHTVTASLHGALESGRLAAEAATRGMRSDKQAA
jgi:phytoene dehydrogenase-like protein